jgi:hypothetical protein
MKNYTNFNKSTYIHTHLTRSNLHKFTQTYIDLRKSKKQTYVDRSLHEARPKRWFLQDAAPDLHVATVAAAQLLQLLGKVRISSGWWQPRS